uniref:Heat shock protein DnaJ domain protein n=1 Tax=Cyanothece sp. (strain PCC 7425 / ATCC 29141) TaxID=395961 RepID=B8HR87_CYAP4
MANLNKLINDEIERISSLYKVETSVLEEFSYFVIAKHKLKDPKPSKPSKATKKKKLALTELKSSIYQYFKVKTTTELKKSGEFKMSTDGMDINLSNRSGWESLYRAFIGILPEEEGETGEGCINGINIFKYAYPWRVFGLNPKTVTDDDIRSAYRNLSKIYHPDAGETGNAAIFDRLTTFYKSLVSEA